MPIAVITGCDDSGNELDLLLSETVSEVANDSLMNAIYRNNYGGCHGQNLESFVERVWKYGNSKEDILNSIKVGYS